MPSNFTVGISAAVFTIMPYQYTVPYDYTIIDNNSWVWEAIPVVAIFLSMMKDSVHMCT